MGARVIVTEVEPLRALEASMDGYQVMPIKEAARIGDVFVTLAGDINVIGKPEFRLMKDGAILANSGHFDVEIDIKVLEQLAVKKRRIRDFVDEYTLPGGRRINLLAQGRLVNLAAAEGHPSEVMDMSFANQALAVEFLFKEGKGLKKKVYQVPGDIDRQIARLKLQTMGVSIDTLTKQQEKYLSSWELGT
jgi:adenosylhomocysteinase